MNTGEGWKCETISCTGAHVQILLWKLLSLFVIQCIKHLETNVTHLIMVVEVYVDKPVSGGVEVCLECEYTALIGDVLKTLHLQFYWSPCYLRTLNYIDSIRGSASQSDREHVLKSIEYKLIPTYTKPIASGHNVQS